MAVVCIRTVHIVYLDMLSKRFLINQLINWDRTACQSGQDGWIIGMLSLPLTPGLAEDPRDLPE